MFLFFVISITSAYSANNLEEQKTSLNLKWHNNDLYSNSIKVGSISEILPKGLSLDRKIQLIRDGFFKITNVITADTDLDSISIKFSFIHDATPTYLMIPCVNYNGNKAGKGNLEPKDFIENGVVRSFEYKRMSIPGATYSESSKFAVAMWGVEQKDITDLNFSSSLYPQKKYVLHTLIYPDEELPNSYSGRDKYSKGYKNYLNLQKGDSIVISFYIYVGQKLPNHTAIHPWLDFVWETANNFYYSVPNCEQVWNRGINYAKKYLWEENDNYKGFNIGLLPNGAGGFSQRNIGKYEIGWCGNNASLANSFLFNFIKTKDSLFLRKAIDCLNTWTKGTQLSNGLFVVHYDNILNKREGILDACNLGAAAYNFFIADSLCLRIGIKKRLLKNIALGICDFMVNNQSPNGMYGKSWNYAGECICREGTIGAFLIPAMLEAYHKTGETKYLQSAQKAFDFYINQFKELGYTSAGALDTWCIDCESAFPMLRSAILLYHATKNKKYLIEADEISYYIATWQWVYDVVKPLDDDFTKYSYHTFGASGVSTQHHHVSSYAVCIVADWLELSELINKPIWKERAIALWRNSSQLISDGSLIVHDLVRPEGSQNEAFFQCGWKFITDTSSINDWLVAWPSAFRLEVLRNIENWKLLE